MSQQKPMVLDSNVFIEPKNRYYSFDFCPGYWDFLITDFKEGNAVSILPVREELLAHEDELASWVKNVVPKIHFEDCVRDNSVLAKQLEIAEYVKNNYAKQNVVADFLAPDVADSWVIAYALVHEGIVVTHETHKPKSKKVSMADVCDQFGIRHIDVFEFLRQEKAKFIYEKEANTE